jgi:hypothetical protein
MQRGEMEMKENNEREGTSSWTKPLLSFSPTFIIGQLYNLIYFQPIKH